MSNFPFRIKIPKYSEYEMESDEKITKHPIAFKEVLILEDLLNSHKVKRIERDGLFDEYWEVDDVIVKFAHRFVRMGDNGYVCSTCHSDNCVHVYVLRAYKVLKLKKYIRVSELEVSKLFIAATIKIL